MWGTVTWGSRRCAVATPGYGRNPLHGLCVAAGWCLATRQSHTQVDRPWFRAGVVVVGVAASTTDGGWDRTGSMTCELVRESHSKADQPHSPKRPSRLCGTARCPLHTTGSRHRSRSTPLPLCSRITRGYGSSLKGLATIAWGWHVTCLPQVDVPRPTLNSEGVGYTACDRSFPRTIVSAIPKSWHASSSPLVAPCRAGLSALCLFNHAIP